MLAELRLTDAHLYDALCDVLNSYCRQSNASFEFLEPSACAFSASNPSSPSDALLEQFTDSFSNYGFHGCPTINWEGIDREGIKQKVMPNVYFIMDRQISESNPEMTITNYMFKYELPMLHQIDIHEYFSRLKHSISAVLEKHNSDFWDEKNMIIVFDRSKASEDPNLRKLWPPPKNQGTLIKEYRAPGFAPNHDEYLDEGAFTMVRQVIPRSSIIGYVEPEFCDRTSVKEKIHMLNATVLKLYELCMDDKYGM